MGQPAEGQGRDHGRGGRGAAAPRSGAPEALGGAHRWRAGLAPSLRWLDIQIYKSSIIKRIHEGSERHVSMAGEWCVLTRTLPESCLAREFRDFEGAWPTGRSPGYFE